MRNISQGVLLASNFLSFATGKPSTSPKQFQWTVGQSVGTASGHVIGRAANNAPEVSTYFGIPYARPPIDDLRFAPPEKYEGTATINATQFVGITAHKGSTTCRTDFNSGSLLPDW